MNMHIHKYIYDTIFKIKNLLGEAFIWNIGSAARREVYAVVLWIPFIFAG